MKKRFSILIAVVASLYCNPSEASLKPIDIDSNLKDFARPLGLPALEFPQLKENEISFISYNVCTGGKGFESFDTGQNFTQDGRHTWKTRKPYMEMFFKGPGAADVYALQEFSAEQALSISVALGKDYSLHVLISHPADVEAGTIRNTQDNAEEIASW